MWREVERCGERKQSLFIAVFKFIAQFSSFLWFLVMIIHKSNVILIVCVSVYAPLVVSICVCVMHCLKSQEDESVTLYVDAPYLWR